MASEPVARRLPGDRFELRRGAWSGVYPMAELPRWIAFYKRMMRRRGRYEHVHAPTVLALERLATDS